MDADEFACPLASHGLRSHMVTKVAKDTNNSAMTKATKAVMDWHLSEPQK